MTELSLADGELQQLDQLECTIERGLNTFVEVGTALLTIRDERLYRSEYDTFEDYCRQRWGFTRQNANRLIEGAEISNSLVSIDTKPSNVGQTRELAKVPEDQREQVWRDTLERTNGKPTAAEVRDTYQPKPPVPEFATGGQPSLDETDDEPIDAAIVEGEPPPPSKPAPVMLTLHTNTGEEVKYPQPQGKPKFNDTEGDGISWANWSWNPVTGCLHGCDYCYARDIATNERYRGAYPVGFTPLFHHERLDAPSATTTPTRYRDDEHPRSCGDGDCQICAYRRVFVCSMADLYGRWVPDEWINQVHAAMLAAPQWQYILLTKFPKRYVGLDLPPNAWVGTSVDEQKRVRIAEDAFRQLDGGTVKWLSLEPLLEPLEFTDLSMFDWVVIGAQTGTRQPDGWLSGFAPPFEWVNRIYNQAIEAGCKVHMKPNLIGKTDHGHPGMVLPNEFPTIKGGN